MTKFAEELTDVNIIRLIEIGFENQNFSVQKTINEIVSKFELEKVTENLIEFVLENIDKRDKIFMCVLERFFQ